MSFVYYGVYAQYYEVGRVELLRSLGISYKKVEELGFALPVVKLNIHYKKPAFYDDELSFKQNYTTWRIMNEKKDDKKMSHCFQQPRANECLSKCGGIKIKIGGI